MKYLICLLALCWIAHAQIMPSARRAAAVQPVAAAVASYLVEESFDASGFDLSWTTVTAGVNADYTTSPAPLEGTQSAYTPGTYCASYTSFTGQSTAYAYFLLNVQTLASSPVVRFNDSSGNARLAVSTTSGGALTINHGGSAKTTTGTLSTNTTYHIWMSYTKASDADGIASIAFSADGTRPTSGNNFTNITAGASTTDVARFYIISDAGSFIYDKLRIDDEIIGSNPD